MPEMTHRDYEDILNTHLRPIRETITRLEAAQKSIIDILAQQARMDEQIQGVNKAIERCIAGHDNLGRLIRENEGEISKMQDKTSDRLWQAAFMLVAALVSFLVGRAT